MSEIILPTSAGNKSARIQELIIKGWMAEKEQKLKNESMARNATIPPSLRAVVFGCSVVVLSAFWIFLHEQVHMSINRIYGCTTDIFINGLGIVGSACEGSALLHGLNELFGYMVGPFIILGGALWVSAKWRGKHATEQRQDCEV